MRKLIILPIVLLMITACNQDQRTSRKLAVYNWSNYVADSTISRFEEQYQVDVIYDNFTNNEELLAKIQAGASGYDVIVPSDYMVEIMIDQGLLKELQMDSIPSHVNVNDKFKKPPYDPNGFYSIPYLWGTVGIGVDTSKVTDYRASWDMLFDKNYKGKISILDDMRYGMVPALKTLGYSINTTDPQELEAATKLMKEQKKLTRVYTSDNYIQLLSSGDIWIAYGFSGDIFQAIRENPNIVYLVPDEGTSVWVDNMCIPKGSKNPWIAHEFINYILKPKVGAELATHTLFASPNASAVDLISSEIVSNTSIYPDSITLSKSEFIKDVGESSVLYDRSWNEIKAQ